MPPSLTVGRCAFITETSSVPHLFARLCLWQEAIFLFLLPGQHGSKLLTSVKLVERICGIVLLLVLYESYAEMEQIEVVNDGRYLVLKAATVQ